MHLGAGRRRAGPQEGEAMTKRTATLLAVLATAAVAAGADFDYFHKTYAKAEKLAKAGDKPLYLHFTTTWCGWCRRNTTCD